MLKLYVLLNLVQSIDIYRNDGDTIYFEIDQYEAVYQSPKVFLNRRKSYNLVIQGSSFAIETEEELYYHHFNPILIGQPQIIVEINPPKNGTTYHQIESSFIRLYTTALHAISQITFMDTDNITDYETFGIQSGLRFSTKEERILHGSVGYGNNIKSIVPYSFSLRFDPVPDLFQTFTEELEEFIDTAEQKIMHFFAIQHIQQTIIYDVRIQDNHLFLDCTLGIIIEETQTQEVISKMNLLDLGHMFESDLNRTEVKATQPIIIKKMEKLIIPFAIMVTICGMIMIGSLVMLVVLGRKNQTKTGEVISSWFIGIFRPTLLVMAETLLWKGYCEQRGLTYHFQNSYGMSLLIMAVLGIIASLLKLCSLVSRARMPEKWDYPWSPGNIATIVGLLMHDLPFTLIIYFFYIKYYSVLASFQLTLMVFQAANMTLLFKYIRVQGQYNKVLKDDKQFWFGNMLTALFFLTVLITVVLMFARTVALQVAKMANLNGANAASIVSMHFFTPNYRNRYDIFGRNCMQTFEQEDGTLVNFPTPFNKDCLNSIEMALLVLVCISYSGIFLVFLFIFKYKKNLRSDKYQTVNGGKGMTGSITSLDGIIPSYPMSISLTKKVPTDNL